jgi:hypothetical protein
MVQLDDDDIYTVINIRKNMSGRGGQTRRWVIELSVFSSPVSSGRSLLLALSLAVDASSSSSQSPSSSLLPPPLTSAPRWSASECLQDQDQDGSGPERAVA